MFDPKVGSATFVKFSIQVFLSYQHIRVYFYFVVLCNFSHFHSETFSSSHGFSLQGFPCKLCVYFFVSHFIIVPFISTSGIKAIKVFFNLVNGNHEIQNSLVGS